MTTLALAASVGCASVPGYVPVAPQAVEAAVPEVAARGSARLEDGSGTAHDVDGSSELLVARPGSLQPQTFRAAYLACHTTNRAPGDCAIEDARARFQLRVDHATLDGEKVASYAVLSALAAGVVAVDAGCFSSWCGTGGKVAVVGGELTVAVVGFLTYALLTVGR